MSVDKFCCHSLHILDAVEVVKLPYCENMLVHYISALLLLLSASDSSGN